MFHSTLHARECGRTRNPRERAPRESSHIRVAANKLDELINLVGESSVGASTRRVEALVGLDAFRELAAERAIVSQLTSSLKAPKDQLPARIAELADAFKVSWSRQDWYDVLVAARGERLP